MTDRTMRDMAAAPALASAPHPPRIIADCEVFEKESGQRLNKNAITDRLRVGLNRNAQERMVFDARHHAGMVPPGA